MQTGVGNQESVAQVLRNVSQRRRHGLLELRFADARVHVLFAQGKIVDVLSPDMNSAEEAARMLFEGGFLNEMPEVESYSRLAEAIRVQNDMNAADSIALVKRAAKHGALSRLYRLDLSAPAFSNFDASMLEFEREFAPSLSIGQLLLDMVALPADRPKFLGLFGGQVLLSRVEKEGLSLSEEEGLLHGLLRKEQSLQDLRRRSLLSEFPLQDGLLRLHEQGLIAIREAPHQEGLGEELLGSDFLTDLDASIDSVFESEGVGSGAAQLSAPPSVIEASAQSADRDEPIIAIASEATRAPSMSRGLRQRIALANARALHAPWIPALVMGLFLAACLLMPLFLWQNVFVAFAG